MKKVLLVATVQSHIAQFHRPLAELLHEHGYEVHVAARNNLAEKNGLALDFVDKVFDIPFSRSPKSFDNIRAYSLLKKIVNGGQYEVVHCNTPMGGIVARLAAINARKRRTKVFYTAHGFHFYKGAPAKNWLVYYPIERLFSRLTDTLITITHEDFKLAARQFHCRVAHIHGVGVDNQRYYRVSKEEKTRQRKAMGYAQGQKLILCIGELNANKNQKMAIRMMHRIVARYPDALLLLAGNGPCRQDLEDFIQQEGLCNHVHMIGYVTNLQDYQHIIDVQVCCSKREGLPLNVVESMLSGNAVVASMNRGHKELIHDGNNGFLVDVDDDEGMADRILALLGDQNLRTAIERNALEFGKLYTFASVKKELASIYGLS